jgi:hypothetical protein
MLNHDGTVWTARVEWYHPIDDQRSLSVVVRTEFFFTTTLTQRCGESFWLLLQYWVVALKRSLLDLSGNNFVNPIPTTLVNMRNLW